MSADRVADVFRDLEDPGRSDLLARLDPETRTALERLLAYPEDSAGSIMTTEFVSVPANWTIAQTLAPHPHGRAHPRDGLRHLRARPGQAHPCPGRVAAPADHGRPGRERPHRRASAQADHGLAAAPREEVARLISKYDLLAVPVVDGNGHVIGIVTVDDVIDAIVEGQTEDVQRFGGMEALDEPYMEIGFWQMIRKRGGWLCALFLSEMLTATAMQGFEGELEKAIVLTLFIPLIMSSGGNSGSQATSLLIRALALQRDPAARLVAGGAARAADRPHARRHPRRDRHRPHRALAEARLLRLRRALGAGGADRRGGAGRHRHLRLACGSMLPFMLQRLGFDPATASAPFVATLVDVTGLVIYFSVALLILRGTLL